MKKDFTGEIVVLEGELVSFSKKQAQAVIYALGGRNKRKVTKETTLLVQGTFLQRTGRSISCIRKKEWEDNIQLRVLAERDFLIEVNRLLVARIRES